MANALMIYKTSFVDSPEYVYALTEDTDLAYLYILLSTNTGTSIMV